MITDTLYPIFTLTITVLACFIQKNKNKKKCGASPPPGYLLGPPKGLTATPRSPAAIVFGFAKNRCAYIFSVLSPEDCHLWYTFVK